MSYLNGPWLTFAGDFQADVSTVNNDVRHYDDASWQDRFQDMQDAGALNGWWNPTGSGSWRLIGCAVNGGADAQGAPVASDPAFGMAVAGAGDRPAGKLVDLDPQWQMASCIFGLAVRLVAADGSEILRGEFEPAPFRDIQFGRQVTGPDSGLIQNAGAVFQSVLTGVRWGPGADASPLLKAIRAQTSGDLLSIRLDTFGYYQVATHARFTIGRLLGAIGPYRAGEPRSFNLGRRFTSVDSQTGFFDGMVSDDGTRITLDLGNALPLASTQGAVADKGALALAVMQGAAPTVIGAIPYRTHDWLAKTGGLVTLPIPLALRAACAASRLALVQTDGAKAVLAVETTDGLHVRADNFVSRLDPNPGPSGGAGVEVRLHAAVYGKPTQGLAIEIADVGPQAGMGGGPPGEKNPPTAPIPVANIPATALTSKDTATTDATGLARLDVLATDPGNPRGYIDGQIYLRSYSLAGMQQSDQNSDLLIFHVRDAYTAPAKPQWSDAAAVLTQFGNLYPVMSRRLIDLSDEADVLANAQVMRLAMKLPLEDCNHMPVTRDLSAAKRDMILAWMEAQSTASRTTEEALAVAEPRPAPSRPPPKAAGAPKALAAAKAAAPRQDIGGKTAFANQMRKAGLMRDTDS